MPNPSLWDSEDSIPPKDRDVKGFDTFPKVISLKFNLIVRLGLDLDFYEVSVLQVRHYTTRIPPKFGRETDGKEKSFLSSLTESISYHELTNVKHR